MQAKHDLLCYARAKATGVLDILAASRANRPNRLVLALHELLFVPREGIPRDISKRLKEIDANFLKFEPNPNPHSSRISVGVRSMHCSKQERLIKEVVRICLDICNAHSRQEASA